MKLILDENQVKLLIREMLSSDNGVVNEIGAEDAYKQFYLNKVKPEQYERLMAGAPTMTPLHKLALDLMLKDGKWDEFLVEQIVKIWTSGNEEAKQHVLDLLPKTPQEKNGFSSWELKRILDNTIAAKKHTENGYAEYGFVKLAETQNFIVTCTMTYSASKKHFGDSHWCTASGIDGSLDGFKMFGEYTGTDENSMSDPAILLQFVDKRNRLDSYQVQMYYDGELGDVCLFNGGGDMNGFLKKMKEEGVGDASTMNGLSVDGNILVNLIGGKEVLDKCIEGTEEGYFMELDYWAKRSREANEKRKLSIMKNAKSYEQPILNLIHKNKQVIRQDSIIVQQFVFGIIELFGDGTGENGKREDGIRIFNVILKGSSEEERDWIGYQYANENPSTMDGFNCQVWIVDDNGEYPTIIKKIERGFSERVVSNVMEVHHGDYYVEDYGYDRDSLYSVKDGALLVKSFDEVRNINNGRPITTSDDNGHRLLLFYEPVSRGVRDKFYVSAIDSVEAKYVGHYDITQIVPKNEVYGNAAIVDLNEIKKHNPPKTVEKAILKANRDMDIEDHGKPTAFRKTMTKNPKAYSRKEKHKEPLNESLSTNLYHFCSLTSALNIIKDGHFHLSHVDRHNTEAGLAKSVSNRRKAIFPYKAVVNTFDELPKHEAEEAIYKVKAPENAPKNACFIFKNGEWSYLPNSENASKLEVSAKRGTAFGTKMGDGRVSYVSADEKLKGEYYMCFSRVPGAFDGYSARMAADKWRGVYVRFSINGDVLNSRYKGGPVNYYTDNEKVNDNQSLVDTPLNVAKNDGKSAFARVKMPTTQDMGPEWAGQINRIKAYEHEDRLFSNEQDIPSRKRKNENIFNTGIVERIDIFIDKRLLKNRKIGINLTLARIGKLLKMCKTYGILKKVHAYDTEKGLSLIPIQNLISNAPTQYAKKKLADKFSGYAELDRADLEKDLKAQQDRVNSLKDVLTNAEAAAIAMLLAILYYGEATDEQSYLESIKRAISSYKLNKFAKEVIDKIPPMSYFDTEIQKPDFFRLSLKYIIHTINGLQGWKITRIGDTLRNIIRDYGKKHGINKLGSIATRKMKIWNKRHGIEFSERRGRPKKNAS